jgi:hypothetical protein
MAAQAHSTIDRIWLRLSAAKDAQEPAAFGTRAGEEEGDRIFFLFLATL